MHYTLCGWHWNLKLLCMSGAFHTSDHVINTTEYNQTHTWRKCRIFTIFLAQCTIANNPSKMQTANFHDALSISCIGARMLGLLVSTIHPFMTISSSIKCAFSKWNMMSSSHCKFEVKRNGKNQIDFSKGKPNSGDRKKPRRNNWNQTYHIAKMTVHGFNQEMYEFQDCKFILQHRKHERGRDITFEVLCKIIYWCKFVGKKKCPG